MTQQTTTTTRGIFTFALIWFGQLISLVGSGLTRFALSVWVFQQTGAVLDYSLILFFSVLPSGLALPLAGALADRWDRRKMMILSDSVAALATLTIVILIFTDQLAIWHIYVAVTIQATAASFQWPAYIAALPLLVPKQHLGRASGLVLLARATSETVAPLFAAALLALVKLDTIILADLVTYLFAVTTLLLVRFPKPRRTAAGIAGQGSLRQEMRYGRAYIRERPGLLALLVYFATLNFALAMLQVLLPPMILSFTSEQVLGLILSAAGAGMLTGGVVMSVWGGPRRRVYGVLAIGLIMSLGLVLSGLRPSPLLIAVGSFIALFGTPIMSGSSQAIWAVKVEADLQGRVTGIRTLWGSLTLPLAFFLAGPLADYVFEPLLAREGLLAGSVGQVIGVGPGRGIALLLILTSILPVLASVLGYLYPRLRLVEDELPDVILTEPALKVPEGVPEAG